VHAKNPGQRKSLTGQGFLEEKGKSLRARKILGLLDAKGKAQAWELQKVLPQVTKRTLRRDLDTLVQKGLLERKGQWNTVFYQIR
jgi:DNA-binding HxlR family transcriptional regulator